MRMRLSEQLTYLETSDYGFFCSFNDPRSPTLPTTQRVWRQQARSTVQIRLLQRFAVT